MKNPLAYTFRVTVWNGWFCWENARWEYNPEWPQFYYGLFTGLLIGYLIK